MTDSPSGHELRLPKGHFGHQGVAGHHFERAAGGVGSTFEVAGDHPHVAIGPFNAHLGRAQDMTRRVQADGDRTDLLAFPPVHVLDLRLVAQAPSSSGPDSAEPK